VKGGNGSITASISTSIIASIITLNLGGAAYLKNYFPERNENNSDNFSPCIHCQPSNYL